MLKKIQIYMWELTGDNYKNAIFRLEKVVGNSMGHKIGNSNSIKKHMNFLEKHYKVKLPKVKWKAIVGDDNGGSMYKWENE